ncbi:response regulator [Benzoatithermus flavus]|uniref:Response regulator n=1 Tax=Benzoatithermus flavus TaxID=3108223 RepID=A0ABU8XNE7_9PROT
MSTAAEEEAPHILVVDDDARLRQLLHRYLVQNGYYATAAADAVEAKSKLKNLAFDLVVLDIMMPGQDGLSLTEELRRESDVPILLLTARGTPEDRIAGLEAGADDYLPKPFEPRELLLRIATILRRVQAARTDDVIRFGPFTFNRRTAELKRDEEVIHLTTGEISLLQALAAKPGRALSRAELGEKGVVAGSDRAVDVQMARLRRKIEDDPRQPRYILTMRGSGYVLRLGS